MVNKRIIKDFLGEIPLSVELFWLLRQRSFAPAGRFRLNALQANLPEACAQVRPLAQNAPRGKQIFIFATLHYWIEHAVLLGLALAGQGHKVTLAYLPYGEWQKPISRFDLRRQNLYAHHVLREATPLLNIVSLMDVHALFQTLPAELNAAVDEVTGFDTQYTLQTETVDKASALYKLRHERNTAAARSAYSWLKAHRPDVVILPNGTIQELGAVYQVARHLKLPAVTYEFGDQRERIWIAQDRQVMRQETDALWKARRDHPLSAEEQGRIQSLFVARQQGRVWENFVRLWQGVPAQGGQEVRAALSLDERPVVLLATNVLGDSLTLGRQVFSQGMGDWLSRTVQYFAQKSDVQLVVRVHPGELLTHGTSMVDVIKEALPSLPENIHIVGPGDKINTYDLVDITSLGLVFTTTVGMEMAMSGIPVIVAGQTHYRERGFTYDPASWDQYFEMLAGLLAGRPVARLDSGRIDLAWQYAYRFFFDYPLVFPWHLVKVWEDYKVRPLAYVLGSEGREKYGRTFSYLAGQPVEW